MRSFIHLFIYYRTVNDHLFFIYLRALAKSPTGDPKNAVIYNNRAQCYIKIEQHRRALDDCEEAIRLDPHDVKTDACTSVSIARQETGIKKPHLQLLPLRVLPVLADTWDRRGNIVALSGRSGFFHRVWSSGALLRASMCSSSAQNFPAAWSVEWPQHCLDARPRIVQSVPSARPSLVSDGKADTFPRAARAETIGFGSTFWHQYAPSEQSLGAVEENALM